MEKIQVAKSFDTENGLDEPDLKDMKDRLELDERHALAGGRIGGGPQKMGFE